MLMRGTVVMTLVSSYRVGEVHHQLTHERNTYPSLPP